MNSLVYRIALISDILTKSDISCAVKSWLNTLGSGDEINAYIAIKFITNSLYLENADDYLYSLLKDYSCGDALEFVYALILAIQKNNYIKDTVRDGSISVKCAEVLGDFLNNHTPKGDEYSDFHYLYDLVKISFLNACYHDIANHLEEVRKISYDLIKNRDSFDLFEDKYRRMDNV